MRNETKIAETIDTGEPKAPFSQAEPAEVNDIDLANVAGGNGPLPLLPSV